MNIYLIRHGRQNSKLCNVDVELSPEGREQADLVGKRLQTYHIDVVYSSQLIRAKETADIINKYLNKRTTYKAIGSSYYSTLHLLNWLHVEVVLNLVYFLAIAFRWGVYFRYQIHQHRCLL